MTLTTTTSNLISVIITAAGSSTRIGGGIKKEYLPFQDGTVISTCIKTFLQTLLPNQKLINFVITTPVGGIENSKKAVFSDSEIKSLLEKNKMQLQFVEGSSTRQSSVFNGSFNGYLSRFFGKDSRRFNLREADWISYDPETAKCGTWIQAP